MGTRLFVVHGSHPCVTVERALALKGIDYRRVEWPPPVHVPAQKLLFGRRTVPAIRFSDGERVSGSRAILRRLDERVPEPRLLPGNAVDRERVLAAEQWGDDVLQPLPRRVLWWALTRQPQAIPRFQEHARLQFPGIALRLMTPAILPIQRRLNRVSDAAVQADLAALPGYLEQVDAWLADGTLNDDTDRINAADLQIAASLRLLMTLDDLHGPLAGRPAGRYALRVFPAYDGQISAGTLPADWLAGLAAG